MMVHSKKYILYDYLQVAGGAERLVLTLGQAYPDFTCVVSRVFPAARLLDELNQAVVCSLGTSGTKWMGRIIEAIRCFSRPLPLLKDPQVICYSGFYAPLAALHQQQGRRVYYCHTPTRYLYDLRENYRASLSLVQRIAFDLFVQWLRPRYERALGSMDCVVANSFNVQQRLKKFLGLKSKVVYPPVDLTCFQWQEQGDYFLSTARLAPKKRVDLIVRAFLNMPKEKLVVVSGGGESDYLKKLAQGASNIHFTGWITDRQLQKWVGGARGVIYLPYDEDFGMSPVEAMAAGKPVIGVCEGGLKETIVHEETGLLLDTPVTIDALMEAVRGLSPKRALRMRQACQERARLFSKETFVGQMKDILNG